MESPQPSNIVLGGLVIDIEIKRGRHLVAKDRQLMGVGKRTSSDPFVKVYGGKEYLGKTSVIEKTCDPVWNEKFQLILGADDANFIMKQKGAVKMELRIFDYDTHKDHDAMGTVKIPLKLWEHPEAKWYKVGKGKGKYLCDDASGELEVMVSVSARKMLSLVRGNNHIITEREIRVGLSWDVENGQEIDLDTSCVAIDKKGNIVMDDTVYYGNLANSNLSVIHSGDEKEGDEAGDDEVITCDLNNIPARIRAMYILLTVATAGKTFANVKSARARILDKSHKVGICSFIPSEFGEHTAMYVVRLARNKRKQWVMSPIEDFDRNARDFGSLIPEIKAYSRDLIPNIEIDPKERVAVMRKGGNIRIQDYLQDENLPKWVCFGLSWDITDGVKIDLDASAICLGHDLRPLDIVFFKQLRSKDNSIRHSGDERDGHKSGDDERIVISLPNTSPDIHYIGFVINSYSGQELDDVAKASCRLYDPRSGINVATYTISNASQLDKHTALIMGCLYRVGDDNWHLRIISEPSHGKTAHDNVEGLQRFLYFHPPGEPSAHSGTKVVENAMPTEVPTQKEEVVVPATELKPHFNSPRPEMSLSPPPSRPPRTRSPHKPKKKKKGGSGEG